MRKALVAGLLGGYLLVLVDLTLVRYPQPGPPPNWRPLATIAYYCRAGGWDCARNVGGNLALFAPLGWLLPAIAAELRSARWVAGFACAASLAIETLQYASGRRVADVDDVLLNTAGAALGYLALALVRPACRAHENSD